MHDINIYNARMRKSLMDKIFFIDKVESTVFIDFGCADASMIKMLNGLFPEYSYIGYDNNPDMIIRAKENEPAAEYFSDWDILLSHIDEKFPDKKKCLILSSVLHEVEDKRDFFEFLQFSHFDYVVIRDMYYSGNPSFIPDSVLDSVPLNIRDHYGVSLRTENEVRLQAIFKSYYPENIESELLEDYFSFGSSDKWLLESHHTFGLLPVYEYHYLLKFWRELIMKDHNYDLASMNIKTHIQLIYEVPKQDQSKQF